MSEADHWTVLLALGDALGSPSHGFLILGTCLLLYFARSCSSLLLCAVWADVWFGHNS